MSSYNIRDMQKAKLEYDAILVHIQMLNFR